MVLITHSVYIVQNTLQRVFFFSGKQTEIQVSIFLVFSFSSIEFRENIRRKHAKPIAGRKGKHKL